MSLSARQKTFFMLALRERPRDADALFAFVVNPESDALKKLYEEVKKDPATDISTIAAAELSKLARPQSQNYLADVHSDWLVELLQGESPDMIATVLRYLPAERVGYILDHLSPETLHDMPKLVDSFNVDAALVDILRRRFESFFAMEEVPTPEEAFSFEHLHLLRATQIAQVFLELGYREIALGLATLPQMTKLLVINRLLPDDRLRVEHYLKKTLPEMHGQRVKKAQVHLISKEVDPRHPDFFVKELGYVLYAKSLLERDRERLEILKRKMPRRDATALDEVVRQYIQTNTDATVLVYREDILLAVKTVLTGREAVESHP